jgi:hypothetical protein
VAATAGLLGAALTVPPARRLLGLAAPGPLGWLLVVAATAVTARLTSPTAADGTRAASDQSDDGVRDRGWDAEPATHVGQEPAHQHGAKHEEELAHDRQ